MIRLALALLLALTLAACESQRLSGISADVGERLEAPRRPLADPALATFAFLPFAAVPGDIGDDLLRRIWQRAEREGLTVVKRPGGRALYTVEGTLTAVSDDTNALIFFVFDVKDVNGQRLHRISGQQGSADSAGEPWSSVTDRDLDLIATRLAALLRAWLYADA